MEEGACLIGEARCGIRSPSQVRCGCQGFPEPAEHIWSSRNQSRDMAGGHLGLWFAPLGCWSWVSDEVSGELSSKRSSMENHVSVALCSFLHMA